MLILICFFVLFLILGDLCAAKFVDDQWYRAKVERLSGTDVIVLYIDFGNRATIPRTKCGVLPASFSALPAFAKEYALAFMSLPPDVSLFTYCERSELRLFDLFQNWRYESKSFLVKIFEKLLSKCEL